MQQGCGFLRPRYLEHSLLIFLVFALQGLERAEQSVVAASASASFKWNPQAFESGALALEQDRDKCTKVSKDLLLQVANPTLLHKVFNNHNHRQHHHREQQQLPLIDATLKRNMVARGGCPEPVNACDPRMIGCHGEEDAIKLLRKKKRRGPAAKMTAPAKHMPPMNQSNIWMHMFSSLILFMQQQGHTDVPTVGKQCKDSTLGR
jgi:hypothetical protein